MPVSPVCSCLSCPTHRGAVERPACGFYPSSSMTDAQWALLEPLLPPPGNTAGRGGRPEKHPRRRVLDAIFYLVRGGIAWAALPAEFPPAKTVYGLFRRWVRAGAWTRLHDALRDRARIAAGRHPLPTAAVIDSASVRGADTVPARSRGYDAGRRVTGRWHGFVSMGKKENGRRDRRHVSGARRADVVTEVRAIEAERDA